MSEPTRNPFAQPCKTCKWSGRIHTSNTWLYCSSLDDRVKRQWTGCIRWEPKTEPQE